MPVDNLFLKPLCSSQAMGLGGSVCHAGEPLKPADSSRSWWICLFFTEASGGAFILHWSETLPEASEGYEPLAHFRPEGTVAKHKYTSKGGVTELCRGVGGPNKKLFYQGWASFLRTAFSHSGMLTFLGNVKACPVAIFFCHVSQHNSISTIDVLGSHSPIFHTYTLRLYSYRTLHLASLTPPYTHTFLLTHRHTRIMCQSDTTVLRFEKDTPLKLTADIVAVAVTPPLATGLDVLKMPTRNFTSVGERSGAAFSLDGGGDGKAEDTAERLKQAKSFARAARDTAMAA